MLIFLYSLLVRKKGRDDMGLYFSFIGKKYNYTPCFTTNVSKEMALVLVLHLIYKYIYVPYIFIYFFNSAVFPIVPGWNSALSIKTKKNGLFYNETKTSNRLDH